MSRIDRRSAPFLPLMSSYCHKFKSYNQLCTCCEVGFWCEGLTSTRFWNHDENEPGFLDTAYTSIVYYRNGIIITVHDFYELIDWDRLLSNRHYNLMTDILLGTVGINLQFLLLYLKTKKEKKKKIKSINQLNPILNELGNIPSSFLIDLQV